tara:strand:- start:51 stop:287 length:237 start_codon:yes stop_codon:yes gene_type:complete
MKLKIKKTTNKVEHEEVFIEEEPFSSEKLKALQHLDCLEQILMDMEEEDDKNKFIAELKVSGGFIEMIRFYIESKCNK